MIKTTIIPSKWIQAFITLLSLEIKMYRNIHVINIYHNGLVTLQRINNFQSIDVVYFLEAKPLITQPVRCVYLPFFNFGSLFLIHLPSFHLITVNYLLN